MPPKLNRYRAFGVHLLGSIIVALLAAILVFVVWYPAPLASATGVGTIFLLLLAVDVVIGPCITLLVFNPAKKELKFDLAVVLLLQIGALLYGMHAVWVARPVYLVFNAGRFDLVYANDLGPEKLKEVSDPRFRSIPLFGPRAIAASMPSDQKERSAIVAAALNGQDDLQQMPKYYVAYEEARGEVLKHIKPLEQLRAFNRGKEAEVDALVQKHSSFKGGTSYLPLKAKVKDLAVIVARGSGEVLEIVPLDPW